MHTEYYHHCLSVNYDRCLTKNNRGSKKQGMTLAERIIKARSHAELTQEELAKKSGISQQAISRLETGKQKTTTDIVSIAIACGVRPEWLALENGEMVDGLYITGDKMKHLFKVAQGLPDYAVDEAIKRIADLAQLLQKAASDKK